MPYDVDIAGRGDVQLMKLSASPSVHQTLGDGAYTVYEPLDDSHPAAARGRVDTTLIVSSPHTCLLPALALVT